MMLQLNPTIPVVTPKGKGFAVGWIDYSLEDDLYWVVFQNDTGECWMFANKDIRAQQNVTVGRKAPVFPGAPQAPVCVNNSPAVLTAFEAGFRAAEKGYNLQAALALETLTPAKPAGRPGKK